MFDVTKNYLTRDGAVVFNLKLVQYNRAGYKSTFPIKGCVKRKGKRVTYQVWMENGRASIWDDHPDDLKEISEPI